MFNTRAGLMFMYKACLCIRHVSSRVSVDKIIRHK